MKTCPQPISLDQKISQMIMMGFSGTDLSQPSNNIISYLEKNLLGGVILFYGNITSPDQLKKLTTQLTTAKSDVFIAVDQEGGKVQRLKKANGFTDYKSAAELVNDNDLNQASKMYEQIACELKINGINVNFAPVVDVNNNKLPCPVIGGLNRSYSDDPATVVQYASTCVDAHRKNDIITALKHFPGHGFAQGDTHAGLTDVTETVSEKELEPFYEMIKQNKTDMIMTAHIMNRNLDKQYPATLSPIILKELLRDKGYEGVIVSDDLCMGAIVNHYSLEESINLAINAGCDLLIFSNNPAAWGKAKHEIDMDIPIKVIETVKQSIAKGTIKQEQIDNSYERLNLLKKKYQI